MLQFDHRDPKDKSNHVGSLVSRSRKRLEDEVGKCDVLCANCHARRTARQFGWYADLA